MKLFLSCKEASARLLEAQDTKQSVAVRTPLQMHVWMCSQCKQFKQQLGLIRQAMQKLDRVE